MVENLNYNADRLHKVTRADIEALEQAMFDYIAARPSQLYSMIAFQMGWRDKLGRLETSQLPKRFIGQAAIASGRCANNAAPTLIGKAAVVELLCNFLMVHGDVQSGNAERNNRATLWWEFGPAHAINAGDALAALARLMLINVLQDADSPLAGDLHIFDNQTLTVCKGAYDEIEYQEKILVSTDDYFKMLRQSRGGLVACAFALGVSNGDLNSKATRQAMECGEILGVAQAIKLDIDTLWGRADARMRGRLATKHKLLPVVYVLNCEDISAKRKMSEIYAQRVINQDKFADIAQIAADCGAREFCDAQLRLHIDLARAALEDWDLDSAARADMNKLANEIVEDQWPI